MTTDVDCHFYVRVPVEGGFRYDSVNLQTPVMNSALRTPHPPVVGDQIFLYDKADDGHKGEFRVLGRSWTHPTFGSANWPYREEEPVEPPLLYLLVEPVDGLFTPLTEEEMASG